MQYFQQKYILQVNFCSLTIFRNFKNVFEKTNFYNCLITIISGIDDKLSTIANPIKLLNMKQSYLLIQQHSLLPLLFPNSCGIPADVFLRIAAPKQFGFS